MDNPGVYTEHLQPDAWPFVPFLGLVAFVPLVILGILLVLGGRTGIAKVRGALTLIASLGLLSVCIVGLGVANNTYYVAEAAYKAEYRQEVGAWVSNTYGLSLSESELSSLLNQEVLSVESAGARARAQLVLDRKNDRIEVVFGSVDSTPAV